MDQKQYITKDSVRDMIMGWSGGFDYIEEPVEGALEDLRGIPTVDAVPVVRCKECKWWRGPIYGNRCSYHSGPNHTEFYDADEFCSRGERKGGDE